MALRVGDADAALHRDTPAGTLAFARSAAPPPLSCPLLCRSGSGVACRVLSPSPSPLSGAGEGRRATRQTATGYPSSHSLAAVGQYFMAGSGLKAQRQAAGLLGRAGLWSAKQFH